MYQLTWVTWKAYPEVVLHNVDIKKQNAASICWSAKMKVLWSGSHQPPHCSHPISQDNQKVSRRFSTLSSFSLQGSMRSAAFSFCFFLFMSGICFDLFIFLNRKKYLSWGRIQGHLQPREAASRDPPIARSTLQSHYQHLHLRFKS